MDAAPTNVLVEGYVESKNHGEKVTKKKRHAYTCQIRDANNEN
jgi:hypothetical protein